MSFIAEYGLFLAKIVTFVIAVIALVAVIFSLSSKKKEGQVQLRLGHPGEDYQALKKTLALAKLPEAEQKAYLKAEKKKQKLEAKQEKSRAKQGSETSAKHTLFLLDFKGSMDASEVSSLRKEISAVLSVATPGDEVLLRLESPGGVVHGYGLAASQLQRIKDHGLPLTAVVDKVAASGGYMMACVASHIVSAPFAIIGSIGVVAQVPNFNRLLKRNDVDIELHTAGQYKRTLTLLGENTEQGREKFREDLNETHQLFKSFVHQMRPSLDIESVATGEHWYGRQALENGLVDEIATSDEVIIRKMDNFRILSVTYGKKKSLLERFTGSSAQAVDRLLLKWWQRSEKPLL